MRLRSRPTRVLAIAAVAGIGIPLAVATGPAAQSQPYQAGQENVFPSMKQGAQANHEAEGPGYQKARERFLESRYLAGTTPLSPEAAARYRNSAAIKAGRMRHVGGTTSSTLTATPSTPTWSEIGPHPVRQLGRSTITRQSVTGRVSALAVSSSGQIYAGGAQGGLWRYDPGTGDPGTGTWTSLTDSLPTLAVGAVALAPGHENVIYLATGEGDLSGDSYTGDGVWKSTDSGATWQHISGSKFIGATISRLVVDPSNPNKLYISTIRGRGGIRRVTPPTHQTWGIYRSTTGGKYWQLLKGTKDPNRGATDLELDPNHPGVLYATFWNDGIYKSNSTGRNWHSLNDSLGDAIIALAPHAAPDYSGSRISIATADIGTTTRIYAGLDWYNATDGAHRNSRLFRSDDNGNTWTFTGQAPAGTIDSVNNYCDIQCTYDNVVEVDPSDPDIVYAAGEYNYSFELGGIYRSTDGGVNWKTLGVDLHPDFHALAFQPGQSNHIVIGNDGGVWDSQTRGGRNGTGDLSEDPPEWTNLNNGGLSIAQFDSIDYGNAAQGDDTVFWGGTQDNGTQARFFGDARWYDMTSGDGGQVVVDHSNDNFVFGTYYNLTGLYRFQNGAALDQVWNNSNIMNGIDLNDRSEFYIPLIQNEGNTQQLFTGTQRVYRSDNAETPVPADVEWTPISDDLTSGCAGGAANGGRACVVSALGVSDGGTGAYAGTEEGWVWSADNATTSTSADDTNWVRDDPAGDVLPGRPVTSFAVDRSNWQTAWVAFAGYNAATPSRPGHVFKTTDGGQTWTPASGNLPDNPVNSLELDPSDPNTVFAGTDVGSFITHDGGTTWNLLGTGIPRVAIWQQSYDPSRGLLVAGTHGRGAWTLDTGIVSPAMVAQISDPGTPVGPGSTIDYTLTIRNVGDAAATGVVVTDPIPAHTGSPVVGDGGAVDGNNNAVWTVPTIAAGDSATLHLSVTIDGGLDPSVTKIVNDGLHVATDQGASTDGSPHVNAIAPQFQAQLSPASEVRTAQLGDSAGFAYTLTNTGYSAQAFDLSLSGQAWTSDIQADCSASGATTGTLAPGESQQVCVQVTVPGGAAGHDQDTFTLTASAADSTDASDDATADGTTIAITNPVALVDDDTNNPDVQPYYTAALDAAGVSYDVIDLSTDDLPDGYLTGYNEVYWFAGASWPSPLAPYEKGLKTYLDSGGKLFMDGLDILDQSAGNTPFVQNYLHIDWDNTNDNDIPSDNETGVPGSVIGDADSAGVPLTPIDGLCACLDNFQPNGSAEAQYTDDSGQPSALAVTDTSGNTGSTYQVVFMAFPVEEMGTGAAGDTTQSALITRVESFFNTP